jgi:hypothetical protein
MTGYYALLPMLSSRLDSDAAPLNRRKAGIDPHLALS